MKIHNLVSSKLEKNTWPRWVLHLSPRYGHAILVSVYLVVTAPLKSKNLILKFPNLIFLTISLVLLRDRKSWTLISTDRQRSDVHALLQKELKYLPVCAWHPNLRGICFVFFPSLPYNVELWRDGQWKVFRQHWNGGEGANDFKWWGDLISYQCTATILQKIVRVQYLVFLWKWQNTLSLLVICFL